MTRCLTNGYDSAAAAGMAVLNAGGCAGDAIEIAIKILEDREITNAGYGSNLAIDGTVECDAVVVDHNGRSGGIGACPRECNTSIFPSTTNLWAEIKNPISLARYLLDKSAKPLSLRRVPPNFLAGQGATNFAYENGFTIMRHDELISPVARERWLKWREELYAASSGIDSSTTGQAILMPDDNNLLQAAAHAEQAQAMRTNSRVLEQGLYNEAQPATPPPSDAISPPRQNATATGRRDGDRVAASPVYRQPTPYPMGWMQSVDKASAMNQTEAATTKHGNDGLQTDPDQPIVPANTDNTDDILPSATSNISRPKESRSDKITDTVGAIAVDLYGHIAAGASSGGIGMKHRGRVGPAALVGVGASVIPTDASDPDRTSVATVTSGTGEHMATTMAAATCSSRIFHGQRKTPGHKFEECTDDEAIRSFIEEDFIGHPSVRRSTTAGAIGILTIKAMKDGAFLYFAHNTESFALSSMTSNDRAPQATMSRRGSSSIAQGGRAVRLTGRRR
ncbi:hypothetical protein MRB53_042090 [Persea americana]|nr:hypothetical protein MRB53_042090 [Persea americana]